MGKKMVVPKFAPFVVHAKKPCPKKDGAVARRVEKRPLKIEAKKEVKVEGRSSRVSKPTRLNWVGSKKRKRDADKKYRRSGALLPTAQEFSEVNDFYVDSEIREMRVSPDRISGDDGLFEGLIDGLLDF